MTLTVAIEGGEFLGKVAPNNVSGLSIWKVTYEFVKPEQEGHPYMARRMTVKLKRKNVSRYEWQSIARRSMWVVEPQFFDPRYWPIDKEHLGKCYKQMTTLEFELLRRRYMA